MRGSEGKEGGVFQGSRGRAKNKEWVSVEGTDEAPWLGPKLRKESAGQ